MPVPNRDVKPPNPAPSTLEQQRAAYAWRRVQGQNKEYANLAKGLPALIMNSGLLQIMAFLHEKGSKPSQQHCKVLGDHLRAWLHERFPHDVPEKFEDFMQALMKADSRKFQAITTESLMWLRWVRQIAAAVLSEEC
jgi:CRISPR-associated protein Cmr5